MIAMRGVQKHFGSLHVLKDIDLEVPAGQVVVVLGPSGSGKSTLCRTINRLEPIDGGEILVSGTVYEAISACDDLTVETERDAELKGFTGTHTLYAVRSASSNR